MSEGSFFPTFIVVFREALEASLIIGIILTVLSRLNAKHYYSHVWTSVILALVASGLAGFALMKATETVQGAMQELIEGSISLVASAILTYMFFWMESQSRKIKSEVEMHLETAISTRDYWAIVSLPFVAVFREGAETVLYLKAVSLQTSSAISATSALAGMALAIAIVSAIFVGGKKISIKYLFQGTGILILFIAAGLLAYGIHELNEFGLIPEVIEHVWDINHILNDKEGAGALLKALFGYNGNPSLTEVIAYFTYLVIMTNILIRKRKSQGK